MEFYLDWKFLVFPTTGSRFAVAPHPFISCGIAVMKHCLFLTELKMKAFGTFFVHLYKKSEIIFACTSFETG